MRAAKKKSVEKPLKKYAVISEPSVIFVLVILLGLFLANIYHVATSEHHKAHSHHLHEQTTKKSQGHQYQTLFFLNKLLSGVKNMSISFESALGLHEKALRLRTQRAEVLANNLANIDTPNYKAKDLDFKSILRQEVDSRMSTAQTNPLHIQANDEVSSEGELLYRTPQQPTIDGNTVEDQIENAEFMKNALALQASFEFLNDEFKELKTAIRGD